MSPAEFRAAREHLGLSTAEMARLLEVTVRAVQMWEHGDRAVPGPVRVALRFMLPPRSQGRVPARSAARSSAQPG